MILDKNTADCCIFDPRCTDLKLLLTYKALKYLDKKLCKLYQGHVVYSPRVDLSLKVKNFISGNVLLTP